MGKFPGLRVLVSRVEEDIAITLENPIQFNKHFSTYYVPALVAGTRDTIHMQIYMQNNRK